MISDRCKVNQACQPSSICMEFHGKTRRWQERRPLSKQVLLAQHGHGRHAPLLHTRKTGDHCSTLLSSDAVSSRPFTCGDLEKHAAQVPHRLCMARGALTMCVGCMSPAFGASGCMSRGVGLRLECAAYFCGLERRAESLLRAVTKVKHYTMPEDSA